jgi:hypothetical protein
MPIVPILVVFAILLGLLVAAVGPALRYAESRGPGDDGEYDGFVPLEWERVVVGGVTTRRFAPAKQHRAGVAAASVAPERAAERQIA